MAYYTGQGDQGRTRLYGGHWIDKDSLRVHAYGSVDELNSFVGLLVSDLSEDFQDLKRDLYHIQQDLYKCTSDLSRLQADGSYKVSSDRITWLEDRVDDYANKTPSITKFIIPGGSRQAAYAHLARTVSRRCERLIVSLSKKEDINPSVLVYLNRLSDYFFASARLLNARLDVEDVVWEQSTDVFSNKDKIDD